MNEDTLAGDQPAALEEIVPYGEECLRQRRRLDHGEAARHLQTGRLGRHAIIGIAATGDERRHRVARREMMDAEPDSRDASGDLDVATAAGAAFTEGGYIVTTVFRLGGAYA